VFDQVKSITEVEAGQIPLPSSKGQVTMQMLQGDPDQAPVVLWIVMEPGAEIARLYTALP
jgi:hypothetical protein